MPHPFAGGVASGIIPKQPAPISFGGTVVGGIRSYVDAGGGAAGKKAAAGVALGAVSTAVPAVGVALGALSAIGIDPTSWLATKSKANWARTWGRVYRAAVLGLVPSIAGAESTLRKIGALWVSSGDSTGAQLWERIVQVFGVPTEKGGTKEGYNVGAPLGSKDAEATPGFSSGLASFLAAVR